MHKLFSYVITYKGASTNHVATQGGGGPKKVRKEPHQLSDFPISIDLSTISIGSGIYRYRYHIGRHVTIGISIAIELVQISKLLYFENLAISAVI